MDKKLTFTGGEPDLNIDDILRDPIANRAALFGLMLGLGVTTDCLISGAAVTVNAGVDAQVTAGYVWLNGEILQVDAATVSETQGTDFWEFQKQVTYDSAGDKTFNDATPRQTWQKNRAVLVNVATITGFDAANAPSLLATIVNNQKATTPQAEAGTDDVKIMTPSKVADFTDRLKFHKVDIGTWDMVATSSKNVAVSGLLAANIVFMQAVILADDTGSGRSPAVIFDTGDTTGWVASGRVIFDDFAGGGAAFVLTRNSASWNTLYDDGAINRGYIIYATLV